MPKISKVAVDKNVCIGSANCVAIGPDDFDLGDDGKAYFKKTLKKGQVIEGEEADVIMEAAQACPVSAIIVHDENGKQIYP